MKFRCCADCCASAKMAAAPPASPRASFTRARNTSLMMYPVDRGIVLPRQFDALPPVLLGGVQVVPLVADPGQADKLLAGIRRFLIAKQLQRAPVAFGRLMELVVRFLYLGQAGCGQNSEVNIPGRLPDRHGFAIDPAGRGTVPLELVTKPQRPGSSTAGCAGYRGAGTRGRGATGRSRLPARTGGSPTWL